MANYFFIRESTSDLSRVFTKIEIHFSILNFPLQNMNVTLRPSRSSDYQFRKQTMHEGHDFAEYLAQHQTITHTINIAARTERKRRIVISVHAPKIRASPV